jgi:hypothetical protein
MVLSGVPGFGQGQSAGPDVKQIFEDFFLCTKLSGGTGKNSLNPKNLFVLPLCHGDIANV